MSAVEQPVPSQNSTTRRGRTLAHRQYLRSHQRQRLLCSRPLRSRNEAHCMHSGTSIILLPRARLCTSTAEAPRQALKADARTATVRFEAKTPWTSTSSNTAQPVTPAISMSATPAPSSVKVDRVFRAPTAAVFGLVVPALCTLI